MAIPSDTPLTATALATAAVSVALASLVWWRRLVRLEKTRRRIAAIRQLSREVVRAPDAASAATQIGEALRQILDDPGLRAAISLPGDPPGRDAFPRDRLEFPLNPEENQPGFLLVHVSEPEILSDELREALSDLALHAAIALEMREQRRLKEQVARGEQLAASSLLFAAIARELRPVLEGILREARQLKLEKLAEDAGTALDLVERLAVFGGRELARPAVFDLSAMLRDLCEFRQSAWRLMQMDVEAGIAAQPLPVLAPRGLLEEAVLGLIVAAEQCLQGGPSPSLSLSAEARGDQAVVSLSLPASSPPSSAPTDSFSACRSLVEHCGGRLERISTAQELRFELCLPLAKQQPAQQERSRPRAPRRQLTLLLVHPELEAIRALIHALADRGHRVVPATDAVQAIEMAARLRFDAVFASPPQDGLDWADFAARVKHHVAVIGWLAASPRPAPAGFPVLPLHLADGDLEEQLAILEGTAGAQDSSIRS